MDELYHAAQAVCIPVQCEYDGSVARQSTLRKTASRQGSKHSSRASSVTLILIAIFKLVKALLLIAVAIGAIRLLHKDVAATLLHWLQIVRVDPDNRYVHDMLARVFRVTPKQLKELSAGTFLYAGLFATEGVGLLLRKRWAEYFTIVTTGLLIPLEVYEMAHHFTPVKLAVTLINVLIVLYLVARVRSR